MTGFRICSPIKKRDCRCKGFHIGLSNGFTVSVQFGRGNYCEHHRDPVWDAPEKGSSYNAETAVFSPKGELMPVNGETVRGWQSPDDVVRLLSTVARLKPTATCIRVRIPREVTS